jgi:peptidoglycan-associated lipoprotein
MKLRFTTPLLFALLATGIVGLGSAASDDTFWVGYWSHLKEVAFARNEYRRAVNPKVLDDDAHWLKEHPDINFYIDGYASKRGDPDYNLKLAQLRAQWVKQSLIKRGVSEDRIKLAIGWGQYYPTCLEESDECLARNKVVRFTYVPAR